MKFVPSFDTHEIKKLSREELIELVQKLIAHKGTEAERHEWIQAFEDNVPHPGGSDLIYWPEKEYTSAEEIVDDALSYKPIHL